jgi:hypothetical protein
VGALNVCPVPWTWLRLGLCLATSYLFRSGTFFAKNLDKTLGCGKMPT